MGRSGLFCCFNAANANRNSKEAQVIFAEAEALDDETLGHSFCYLRSNSPTPSDRFPSPSNSYRLSPSSHETALKSISGASVSANSSVPKTVLQLDNSCHYHDSASARANVVNGFKSTPSFSALPLQPLPRVGGGGALFLSGPIETRAHSGPLDDGAGGVHFSAPLGGLYVKKKKRSKGIAGFRKAFRRSFPEKKRPWVVPVLNFVGRKEAPVSEEEQGGESNNNVQWALGKAGEDRVHVVVSEEQGWLFVGIYDGFNGPDAPEFLMGHLYRAVYSELQGLFWEVKEPHGDSHANTAPPPAPAVLDETESKPKCEGEVESTKRVTFQVEGTESRRRMLWEFLEEDDAEDGLDLSGSDRFAFSVEDALSASKEGSAGSRRWLLLSKWKKHGLSKHKEGHGRRKLMPWNLGTEEEKERFEVENQAEEKEKSRGGNGDGGRKRKVGPVDHDLVLRAMSRALGMTELAYLVMTDKVIDTNPELALMGSCLLVVLMRDEDVYVMNVGDSRAIVAHYENNGDVESSMESIVEESLALGKNAAAAKLGNEGAAQEMRLVALQLSTDHSTSIEEPKWNDVVLQMFRHEYIGTAPYVSCCPSLCHHRLCPRDQFLILSSDGLYQYLSNQEVVSQVESFMEKFPDGDPAQHLIEELLLRAAKKAGMDLHELLDIPQGDRRKYHDDVTVMVISLEGRIWKSSGKYL